MRNRQRLRPQWVVASGTNAGGFGLCYPVLLESTLDPNDILRYKRLPGPFETILCSSNCTAERLAAWLNQQALEAE